MHARELLKLALDVYKEVEQAAKDGPITVSEAITIGADAAQQAVLDLGIAHNHLWKKEK